MGNRVSNPTKREHYWYKALLLGLFLSAAFFIPYIVMGDGYFLYYGDFNVQQVPFYQMVHDAVRSGEFGWSTTTDLGSSLIGSYTFYLLTSPFFWLTLPFPSEFVPYMMGPLLILKFGMASLTGYIYLRRYTRNKNIAVLGGLLYAFSGFSVYNVFFNHFHEAIVFFPLLLASIDEYMETKRRGVVALAVFACCWVNYYFFVGMVAFVIIYWFVKMYMNCWKLNTKEFFALAFEVVVGFAGTAIILIPTVLFVLQNPRVSDSPVGWGTLLYSSEQRYLHIISSMFFPPDIPARPNFTPDSNSKWASIAAWLPLFGMTGVIGFLQSKSKGWLKKLLPFLLLCTLIPILNSIFQMFVMSYYARWFYMLTLMMSLATVIAIENSQTNWKRAITWSTTITVSIAIGVGLIPNGEETEEETFLEMFGLEKYPERFWIYVAVAMLSLALVTLLIRSLKINKKTFAVKATACFGVIAVLYSGYVIGLGRSHSYDVHDFIIPCVLNNGKSVKLEDDLQNVRSDFYETMDNVGMFWQIPTIQAFQSVVPGSIYEFYPTVGVPRDVGSRPETKVYGIRSLLSVKYLFDYAGDDDNFENEKGQTRMPGYAYIGTQNGYKVYENKNFIPYGFCYDSYITEKQYEECPEGDRHLLLLKAMVLTDDQAGKYGDIMNRIVDTKVLTYDEASFAADCKALNRDTCSKFEYGNSSFTAEITLPEGKDRLVFFSVPYENGWSAKVNGVEAEIEKVNIGFMAVRVEGGTTSTIEFEYHTPGLNVGIIVSALCVVLYIVYMVISKKKNLIKPLPKLKKSYKVAALGSANELGEKYRNLTLGSRPMRKRPLPPVLEDEIDEVVSDSTEDTLESQIDEVVENSTENDSSTTENDVTEAVPNNLETENTVSDENESEVKEEKKTLSLKKAVDEQTSEQAESNDTTAENDSHDGEE